MPRAVPWQSCPLKTGEKRRWPSGYSGSESGLRITDMFNMGGDNKNKETYVFSLNLWRSFMNYFDKFVLCTILLMLLES